MKTLNFEIQGNLVDRRRKRKKAKPHLEKMTSLPEEMPEHVVHEKFLEQILENKEEIEDFVHKIIIESKYTQTISPRILNTLLTHCQSEVLLVRPSNS